MEDCSAEFIGLSAAEPGYSCVRVSPNLASGSSVQCCVALSIGQVAVAWDKTDGSFRLDVEVPVGIHLQVCLPAGRDDILLVDGEPIAEDTQTMRGADFVELAVMPGSRYVFEVRSF